MSFDLVKCSTVSWAKLAFAIICSMVIAACDSNSSTKNNGSTNKSSSSTSTELSENFSLQFKAMVGSSELNCDDIYPGFGPDESYSVGVGDLRFYVSNLKFYDSAGTELATTLDDGDFQLNHESGSVALIDFSGTDSGYCEIASEGTPRTNNVITGAVSGESAIAAVSFDVGVSQATMKAVIAASDDVSDTPSPLAEMHWSWAAGYRHFVVNFTSMDETHTDMVENSGFHIGSRDCGDAGKALGDQDTCGLINTPQVMLNDFDPSVNSVVVDLASLLAGAQEADFEGADNFGIQCHSAAAQSACASLFPNFGLNLETGTADASGNTVFGME